MSADPDEVIGCEPIVLSEFHRRELRRCISELEHVKKVEMFLSYRERFNVILTVYSNRLLLYPELPELVSRLLEGVNLSTLPLSTRCQWSLSFLWTLSSAVKFENVARFLPADVSHLEKIVSSIEFYLERFQNKEIVEDELDVVKALHVWLYIIMKNPFDLDKVSRNQNLTRRIHKSVLSFNQRLNSRLSLVIEAQLYTRNASNSKALSELTDNILHMEMSSNQAVHYLSLLCAIFKLGKAEELRSLVDQVLNFVENLTKKYPNQSLITYLAVKLSQRVCMLLLPPSLAQWRYCKTETSIEENFNETRAPKRKSMQEHSYEPDERVSMVFAKLQKQLFNDDGKVRWSAAKGLSRLCARLPVDFSERLFKEVMDGALRNVSSSFWSGACLVVAELTNRGCILPHMVPDILSLICKALVCDTSNTRNTTEVVVRDSACYICWSLARSYQPETFESAIQELAFVLACTALFDRDVNVRRAASAAFQEHVGRHGRFPHGIHVLVLIDFTAVSLLANGYDHLCVQVVEHTEYFVPVVNFLLSFKVRHWHPQVRELAANALGKLSEVNRNYFSKQVLPKLLESLSTCTDIDSKHGTLLSIAAILVHVHEAPPDLVTVFTDFVAQNEHFMRNQAIENISFLIDGVSAVVAVILDQDLLHDVNIVSHWIEMTLSVLQHRNADLRLMSSSVFPSYANVVSSALNFYTRNDRHMMVDEFLNRCLNQVRIFDAPIQLQLETCTTDKQFMAWVLPLSSLSHQVIRNNKQALDKIVTLLVASVARPQEPTWISSRISCLEALCYFGSSGNTSLNAVDIIECLVNALCDQTRLKSGADVGSYLRKFAITKTPHTLATLRNAGQLTQHDVDLVIGKLIARTFDPVENISKSATEVIKELIQTDLNISEKQVLSDLFGAAEHDSTSMKTLLDSPTYRQFLFEVLVLAIGSSNVLLANSAWTLWDSYYSLETNDAVGPKKQSLECMEDTVRHLLGLVAHLEDTADRIKFWSAFRKMLEWGTFEVFEKNPDNNLLFREICELVVKTSQQKSTHSLRRALIHALASLLLLPLHTLIWAEARNKLVCFLNSPYPVMRSVAAEQLHHYLSLAPEPVYNLRPIQEALALLADHNWSSPDKTTAEASSQVSQLLKQV